MKETIKDIIFREQTSFCNEIYDNEELTQKECELLDHTVANFSDKVQQIIDEVYGVEICTTFKRLVVSELVEKLNEYKGSSIYGCDLAYTLLEQYNVDGSYTYNTKKSVELIKEYWDDMGEVYEYVVNNLEVHCNPFEEPEKFLVIMLLEEANALLTQCEIVDKYWNNTIELNDENIKTIIEELYMQDI